LPAVQLVQTVEASAAAYLPAPHKVHTVEAVSAAYVPALHNEQFAADADVAPACPYVPAEQSVPLQVDEAVSAAYLPAPQLAQVEFTLAPTAAENLPAAQLMQ
jgi:hypothetical protein